MKRTFFLFIAVSLLTTSCRKDDDNYNNDTINPELLVATWRPTSAKIISGVDGSTLDPLDIPTCRNLWEYIYESNGSFILKKYAKNADGECTRREDWDDHGIYTFDPSTNTLKMEDDEGILGETEIF
ncbi:hypothetical protein H8B06_06175 [Sphingobacterium sp. DN00404]|uniref:Lipocalin-like domain-containing protein n=1 Tax=Sphingobacterium micropteri TaxID=2763501 RepID=A0ABR7YM53_9SPHI|nr:hypothetical protein [Sphingobacterium micropteri]MBD1432404.1 hypothetical protein [Sphingobacterium micropteri]